MLSPTLITASRQIYEAVPQLPKVITDLMSEYYSFDDLTELAQRCIKVVCTNNFIEGSYVKNQYPQFAVENPEELKAVVFCLTSPDCCPSIKAAVIKNFLLAPDAFGYQYFNYHEFDTTRATGMLHPKRLAIREIFNSIQGRLNLDNTDLSGLNLRNCNFEGMSAIGARFTNSRLEWTNLSHANLTFADFSDADLSNANLEYAMVAGADLRRSTVRGAKINWANFTGADLRGCRDLMTQGSCRETVICNTKMGEVGFQAYVESRLGKAAARYLPDIYWVQKGILQVTEKYLMVTDERYLPKSGSSKISKSCLPSGR